MVGIFKTGRDSRKLRLMNSGYIKTPLNLLVVAPANGDVSSNQKFFIFFPGPQILYPCS
jgi:hypothetical protein